MRLPAAAWQPVNCNSNRCILRLSQQRYVKTPFVLLAVSLSSSICSKPTVLTAMKSTTAMPAPCLADEEAKQLLEWPALCRQVNIAELLATVAMHVHY
jgi:hypothetical protein